MRFDISYRMEFRYPEPVWESQNEIRARPRDDGRQRVLSYRLTSDPLCRVLSYRDYWGTTVDQLGVRHRHDRFEVTADAAVETLPDAAAIVTDQARWRSDRREFLEPTRHTTWTEEISAIARSRVDPIGDAAGRILAVSELVHSLLRYASGTTEIGITPVDLVEQGTGVCQDFAHLTIAMLRSLEIPARYVSGYLFAADETDLGDGVQTEAVSVQTHAWVEAATDEGEWIAVDPTNQTVAGERHVVIGHGRDYDDVPPVRGVFTGPGVPIVDAQVTIARLSPIVQTVTSDRGRPDRRPRRNDQLQQ